VGLNEGVGRGFFWSKGYDCTLARRAHRLDQFHTPTAEVWKVTPFWAVLGRFWGVVISTVHSDSELPRYRDSSIEIGIGRGES
jgi:hypothetical protein